MIAVIADDFTGAAEIGGIGLKRGLRVLIETSVDAVEDIDLLVVATETRSMSVEQAKVEIGKVTRQLIDLNPEYIFKKLDSVLRGHLYEELKSQQNVQKKQRVIMVPANPHFNRIINNGIYYISGVPLAETSFANDPEFPVKSSYVMDIIGKNREDVVVKSVNEDLPGKGVIVGNVNTTEELDMWAEKIDDQSVLAGGSGFFDALLNKKFPAVSKNGESSLFPGKHSLFILGSTFPKDKEICSKFSDVGIEIINLNNDIFIEQDSPSKVLFSLAERIATAINENNRVAITTISSDKNITVSAETIRKNMGRIVKKVFNMVEIDDLFIEGGATASLILNNLGISKLKPFRDLGSGVIQMHPVGNEGLIITTKPGSYLWPEIKIIN